VLIAAAATILIPLSAPLGTAGASVKKTSYVAVGMNGVSCVPGECVAVGIAQGPGTASTPQAWTLSHGQWTVATLPSGRARWVSLTSVSCPQAGSCLAVGDAEFGANEEGFAARLDAGIWTRTPLPPGTPPLRSVSCVSPTWCMAVGTASQATSAGLALLWNGTTWSRVETASVAYGAEFFGVSCTSTKFCMAVGGAVATPFAETWDGAAWTVSLAPTTAAPESYDLLVAISCTSASFCLTTGDFGGCCGSYNATSFKWDGTSWTSVLTPITQVSLSGISCASATSCVAAGTYGPSDIPKFPPRAVVEQWNGSAWAPLTGSAFGPQSELSGVSCTRAIWCAAVGSVTMRVGATLWFVNAGCAQPLVERWNGATLNRMWAAD
jgi:hypothetical protein